MQCTLFVVMKERLTNAEIKRNKIEAYLKELKQNDIPKAKALYWAAQKFNLTQQRIWQILKPLELYNTKNNENKTTDQK